MRNLGVVVSRVNRLVRETGDNWRDWDHITNHNYFSCHSSPLSSPVLYLNHSAMSISSSDRRWSKFNGIKSRSLMLLLVMKPRSAHTRGPLSKMWFNEILAAAASRDAGKWVIMTVLMCQFRSNVAMWNSHGTSNVWRHWLATCISFNSRDIYLGYIVFLSMFWEHRVTLFSFLYYQL